MDIIGLISNAFGIISGWFGFSKQKDAQLNTDLMKANKEAGIDLKVHEQDVKEIASGDLNAIRNHPID